MNKSISAVTFLIFCGLTQQASAQQIYSWKDAQGRTHYSTTAKSRLAETTKLPEIQRENIDKKIELIKETTPGSCESMGGIDCSAGKDKKDGSVICVNGDKNSHEKFSEVCLKAKLYSDALAEISQDEIIPLDKLNPSKLENTAAKKLVVMARNTSPVEASGVSVEVKLTMLSGLITVDAQGPSKIAPYASEEYVVDLSKLPSQVPPRLLKRARYTLTCKNCASVRYGS